MSGCAGPKIEVAFFRLLYFGVGVLWLAGCALLPTAEQTVSVTTAYDHVLSAGWVAVRDWEPINLDGDEEEENLLLFRFDNGQVGALIVEGDPTTSISPPDRILPRQFDERGALGQGVIAAPGTPSRAITVTHVSGNDPSRELVIWGNGTHLTFAWWKGANLGYGVTQLYAPGGFGVDWATWQQNPTPLTSVMAYFPLQDYRARANLCELQLYTRRTDLPSDTSTITFTSEPQGLHFCNSKIPPHPFAPEGVVMAYLRWPRAGDGGMLSLLTPGTTLAQVDAESAAERWPMEWVVDIAAYRALPMGQEAVAATLAPTTTVCVEFAERANRRLRRWLVYTLRLQLADVTQRLPDRWTVSGAFAEPPPLELPPLEPLASGYCEQILDRNAP